MVQILVLLLGSATVGVMIAPRHNVYMILAASPIVAMVAATEARLSGFGVLATVAITFGCVTISQIAYLLMMWLSMTDGVALTDMPSNNHSRQNSQSKIHNK